MVLDHVLLMYFMMVHNYVVDDTCLFSIRLQAILATHGIPTQTQKQVEPIKIRRPGDILLKVVDSLNMFTIE